MKLNTENIKNKLTSHGLKATLQRMLIYQTLLECRTHPTAEEIYSSIKLSYPSISLSTIYNTLESFVENKLISLVKTDTSVFRYEAFNEPHHHLYSENDKQIVDYYDDELNRILKEYFEKKQIPNFDIIDIKLLIKGIFTNKIKD